MSASIPVEFQIFCYAIMLGAACQLLYDVLRIIMKVFVHSIFITGILDICFWIVTAISMFTFMYQINGGILRGYGIVGMAIGMLLLELSLGNLFVRYISKFLRYLIKGLKIIVKKFMEILKRLLKIATKPFTILLRKMKDKRNRKVNAHECSKKEKKMYRQKEKNKSCQ